MQLFGVFYLSAFYEMLMLHWHGPDGVALGFPDVKTHVKHPSISDPSLFVHKQQLITAAVSLLSSYLKDTWRFKGAFCRNTFEIDCIYSSTSYCAPHVLQ